MRGMQSLGRMRCHGMYGFRMASAVAREVLEDRQGHFFLFIFPPIKHIFTAYLFMLLFITPFSLQK